MAFGLTFEETLDKLQRRNAQWDIDSGRWYFESSDMRMNVNPKNSWKWNHDDTVQETLENMNTKPWAYANMLSHTNHDIRDMAQFQDWMTSRAKQAEALQYDLGLLAELMQERPDFKSTQDCQDLTVSLTDRALMALYGIDNGSNYTFEEAVINNGEQACTSYRLGEMIQSGPDKIVELQNELGQFAKNWTQIKAAEERAKAAGVKNTGIKLEYRDLPQYNTEVYTKDMLYQYAAVLFGREGFCERQNQDPYCSQALSGHGTAMTIDCSDPDILQTVACIDTVCNDVNFEDNWGGRKQDKTTILSDIYAFEPASILKNINEHKAEIVPYVQAQTNGPRYKSWRLRCVEADKIITPEPDMKTERDMQDIDAAANSLQKSDNKQSDKQNDWDPPF